MKVLPARRAQDATPPVAPLAVLDELPLPGGCRVLVVRDAAGVLYTVPVTGRGTDRAGPGDGVAAALVGLLGPGPARVGSFELVRRYAAPATGEQAVTADQTNESVVVGGAAVVKWTVRPTTDPHPAPHRLAQLTAVGFTGMPRLWGLLLWHDPRRAGSEPVLLATVSDYLPGATDGWEWAVADLRAVAAGDVRPPDDTAPAQADRTADSGAAPGPRRCRDPTRDACRGRCLARPGAGRPRPGRPGGDRARGCSAGGLRGPGPAQAGPARRRGGDAGRRRARRPARRPGAAGRRPVPRHRLRRQPGAGPGRTHRTRTRPRSTSPACCSRWTTSRGWCCTARRGSTPASCSTGCRGPRPRSWPPTGAASTRPVAATCWTSRLLGAFRVQQEVREHLYAVAHLPHWRYVPDAALPALLDELDVDGRDARRVPRRRRGRSRAGCSTWPSPVSEAAPGRAHRCGPGPPCPARDGLVGLRSWRRGGPAARPRHRRGRRASPTRSPAVSRAGGGRRRLRTFRHTLALLLALGGRPATTLLGPPGRAVLREGRDDRGGARPATGRTRRLPDPRTDYRMLRMAGSRCGGRAPRWTDERAPSSSRSAPTAHLAATVRYRGDEDDVVRLLADVMAPELVAAQLWGRHSA